MVCNQLKNILSLGYQEYLEQKYTRYYLETLAKNQKTNLKNNSNDKNQKTNKNKKNNQNPKQNIHIPKWYQRKKRRRTNQQESELLARKAIENNNKIKNINQQSDNKNKNHNENKNYYNNNTQDNFNRNDNSVKKNKTNEQKDEENEINLDYFGILPTNKTTIIIHPLFGYINLLSKLNPTYLIIYDIDLKLIRELEIFVATNQNIIKKIYLMNSEQESINEKYFKFSINREINSFNELLEINEKLKDLKLDQNKQLNFKNWVRKQEEKGNKLLKEFLEIDPNNQQNNIRKTNKKLKEKENQNQNENENEIEIEIETETKTKTKTILNNNQPTVIPKINNQNDNQKTLTKKNKPIVLIDNREFMGSSIPFMINKEGIKLIPLQLKVGDFIISPDICIERKTLPDLISSFKDGRLFSQAIAMTDHYSVVILLLEFNEKKDFRFVNPNFVLNHSYDEFLIERLTTVLTNFPKMKILWCRNSSVAAKTIKLLKSDRIEPDQKRAMQIQKTSYFDKYSNIINNHTQWKILLKMPGINIVNIEKIIFNVTNILSLVTMKLENLIQLIGNENGTKLYNFLNNIN